MTTVLNYNFAQKETTVILIYLGFIMTMFPLS